MPNAIKPIDSLSDDEFAHIVQPAIALPDAPPLFVRAAIDLWPASHPVPLKSVAQAALRLVIAALSFDSWARLPVALGMRATVSDTRHLLNWRIAPFCPGSGKAFRPSGSAQTPGTSDSHREHLGKSMR